MRTTEPFARRTLASWAGSVRPEQPPAEVSSRPQAGIWGAGGTGQALAWAMPSACGPVPPAVVLAPDPCPPDPNPYLGRPSRVWKLSCSLLRRVLGVGALDLK